MTKTPIAQIVHRKGLWSSHADFCELDYTARFLPGKRLTSAAGQQFLADLPHSLSLDHSDALALDDRRLVEIAAADEDLLSVAGPDIVQLAWHVGNRHTPCQIAHDNLLIQADSIIGHMLEYLDATVKAVVARFTPKGGAYGHGRTHAHEHVATAHDH